MPVASLELHPEALEEALAAYAYYLERSLRAADGFLAELDHALTRVLDLADTWPPYLYGTRRFLVRDFPYSVVYKVSADRVIVYAVAHAKRRPGYWRPRLGRGPV